MIISVDLYSSKFFGWRPHQEIGDMNAMKAAYLNDEQIVKVGDVFVRVRKR